MIAPMIMHSRKEKSAHMPPLAFIVPQRKRPMPNAQTNVPMIAKVKMDPMLRKRD